MLNPRRELGEMAHVICTENIEVHVRSLWDFFEIETRTFNVCQRTKRCTHFVSESKLRFLVLQLMSF